MRYDDAVIDQVREANDIVDVIGQHVRLTKKGANYFGLCPFHGEKTASFSVSPRKQIYYCFGCGAGGNVISFLMEYENYSFQEALKALADRAHIELPEAKETGEERGRRELKDRLLEVHKEAALFYYRQLHSPEGEAGYRYFRGQRRLSDATITHFGLGFSPKSSDALYRYLKEKGYSDQLLKDSGLVNIQERQTRDRFWNRVMFPIMDTNNRVIGFGGRVMGDGLPKYLNSPETLIFDKSSNLYGLNFAKKSRRRELLLCEGYMDVIALHQAGFTNAVASLGTAFNEKHARLLKRYTDQVILTQDSDAAGISAKLRAYPILYAAGLKVRVLDMGKYKDPDEFIRAEGPDAYETCIRNAKNAFLFMADVLRRNYDLSDPAEKTAYYREVADRLCMFKEPLERENYIDSVSREFMIPKEELKDLVDRQIAVRGAGIETVKSLAGAFEVRGAREKEHPDRFQMMRSASENRSAVNAGRDVQGSSARETQGGGGRQNNTSGNGFQRNSQQAADGGDPNRYGTGQGDDRPRDPGNFQNSRNIRNPQMEDSLTDSHAEAYEMALMGMLCERPELCRYVFPYAAPESFQNEVCRDIAAEIAAHPGYFDAAAFLDRYENDEYLRKIAALIFAEDEHGQSLSEMSRLDLEKALSESVRLLLTARLDREIADCGNDLQAFGRLLREKNRLQGFRITIED